MGASDRGHPRASRLGRLLVVLGLTGFAISQPLLSLFGGQPLFFIARSFDGWALVWFAVIVAFVPPLVLWGGTELVHVASPRGGAAVHLATVACLATLALVPNVVSALDRTGVSWGVSAGLALVGTYVYWRFWVVGTWLSYTAVLPVLALVAFIGFSDSGERVRTPEGGSAAAVEGADIPSVVFVMFDELPTQSMLDATGAIDRDRFPNFAAFGDSATWYPEYTTVGSLTYLAVPSALTGASPVVDAQPTMRDYPDNLFTLLQPTHDLVAYETITDLCGLPACEGESTRTSLPQTIGDAVDLFRERFRRDEQQVGFVPEFRKEFVPSATIDVMGHEQNEELIASMTQLPGLVPAPFADFVNGLDEWSEPSLQYLHMSVPHGPWSMHPDGTRYEWATPMVAGYPRSEGLELEYAMALNEQRHLLQAEWADRLLGVLVAKLETIDRYDETLIVVTADHGVSFAESSWGRYVTPGNLAGIAYSPLFIKAPGQAQGAVDRSNVMSIDLLPVLAEQLDLALPFDVDGSRVGDPEMDARGTSKFLYDVEGRFSAETEFGYVFEGVVEFDAADGLPDPTNRRTGTTYDASRPIQGLLEWAEVDEFIGRPLDDLTSTRFGTARVRWAERFADPDGDQPGGVIGALRGGATGEAILVALDGIVVTGSPLYTLDGRPDSFAALLPPGALDESGNELRIAVVSDGAVTEVDQIP